MPYLHPEAGQFNQIYLLDKHFSLSAEVVGGLEELGVSFSICDLEFVERLSAPSLVLAQVNPATFQQYSELRRQFVDHTFLVVASGWISSQLDEIFPAQNEVVFLQSEFYASRLSFFVRRELAILEQYEEARHFRNVIQAMREIRNLGETETSLQSIIEKACKALVENRGYHNGWIAILGPNNGVLEVAGSGIVETGKSNVAGRSHRFSTPCLTAAMKAESGELQLCHPKVDCCDCFMAGNYDGRCGLSLRFELDEGHWGLCTVSVPEAVARRDSERDLFAELCDDIATVVKRFRESERGKYLLEVISNVHEPMSMVARDYTYLVVNDAYTRFYNVPTEEIVGQKVSDFLGLELFEEQIKARLDRAFGGESVRYEVGCDFPGFGWAEMEVVYSPVRDADRQIYAVVAHSRVITERKRAESELRRQKEEFQAILEASNVGAWQWYIDEGRIAINARWGEMIGYSDLGPEVDFAFWEDITHPEDVGLISKHVAEYLEDPSGVFEHEFRMRSNTGTWVWMHASGRLVEPDPETGSRRMSGINLDVTERVKGYERLGAAQQELELLLEGINSTEDGILITRADWPPEQAEIVFASEGFCRLSGYEREELIGKTMEFLQCERSNCDALSDLKSCLKEGLSFVGETTNQHRDGRFYPVAWHVSPVRDELGRVMHYISVQRDITNQREMEGRVQLLTKMESVGQLAAGIAHEINTPSQFINDNLQFLNDCWEDAAPLVAHAVSALADPCEREALKESFEEIPVALEDALEGVQRIKTIVTAMREFSHPQDEFSQTDLNHAIKTTTTVARNEWKYNSDLEFDLDPELPKVACVPGDINQAILNIVVNASHAIKERYGDGEHSGLIRIVSRRVADRVQIAITDNGGGIPERVGQRIFDPFFTTKQVGKGTGQGLYLAHNAIVNKHRGALYFETEDGVGTTFFIELSIEKADELE